MQKPSEKVRELNAVIDATRALFHRMKASAEAIHESDSITAGLRAVLQELHTHGPRTVPDMARARPVSRQLIQTLVNRLVEEEYVEFRPNPAHKRSKLVALTLSGKQVFEGIRLREVELLEELPIQAATEDLAGAARVLQDIRRGFEDMDLQSRSREEEGRGGNEP